MLSVSKVLTFALELDHKQRRNHLGLARVTVLSSLEVYALKASVDACVKYTFCRSLILELMHT